MITLGIETSCDETAVAVVEDGQVLSNEISSSVHLHAQYGGVIPEIASRFHVEYIYSVCEKALKDADRNIKDVDLIAVTQGPGLPGSVLIGIAFAKAISFAGDIPIVGVDHLKAHVVSCFLSRESILDMFPFVGVVVSGGHTSIYHCKSLQEFVLIGRTKDDAAGEAFDKVAKLMELEYPGGPVIEKRANNFQGGEKINFPRALLQDAENLDFSFSGIKTAVMYHWKECEKNEQEKDRICYSFQEAVVDVIDKKIQRAVSLTGTKRLAVGGGVVNNSLLRERLAASCDREKIELFLPDKEFCADNAAMIALLGENNFRTTKEASDLYLNAKI